jgi:peptide/nickel transport system substrate-binding protein
MADDARQSRRQFLKGTGSIAAAAAIAGCSGGDGGSTPEPTPTEGSDGGDGGMDSTTPEPTETASDSTATSGGDAPMYRLTTQTMDNFDPIASTSADASAIIEQVFDPLVDTINAELPAEPVLAEDYEITNDGKTYTFQLKEGVQFHNGDELTAQDVEYSWRRLSDSPNTRRSGYFLNSLGIDYETDENGEYVAGSVAVEAVDDYTFEMTLSRPYAWAAEILGYKSFSVIPEGIVGDLEGYEGEMSQDEFATENPVGAGPFEFDHWESGTEVEVHTFDDYHGETASIGGVHWQVITDSNAEYNYSMNQNSDAIAIPTSQFDSDKVSIDEEDDLGRQIGTYGPLRNDETADYLVVPDLSTYFIGFNTENVEKPARQATAHVITQAGLNENVYKGLHIPAFHVTPEPIYPGGVEAAEQHARDNYPYGYNEPQVQAARQVMEDAGYGEDNRYSFSIYTTDNSTQQQMLGRIRDKLATAHIDLNIEVSPFSTWWAQQKEGDYDAMLFSWGMGWSDPANILALNYPPNADSSIEDTMVGTNWSDTEASQQAMEAYETYQDNARATEEAAEIRQEAVNTMEEAIWEDVPMTTLIYFTSRRYTYDWVDVPKYGTVGGQQYNQVEIDADAQPD